MATREGLPKIWMTPFDRPTPKTPSLVQNSGTYLKCELSYCDFCVEISKFRYHGNRGWCDTNFTHTVKSADPENPLFGARILMISHTQAELQSIFWQNLPIFVTMATRVGLAKIWMTPFDRPTTKTPGWVQNFGTYLKCELSYGKFWVEISTFSFPWQQGLVWHKFHLHTFNFCTASLSRE